MTVIITFHIPQWLHTETVQIPSKIEPWRITNKTKFLKSTEFVSVILNTSSNNPTARSRKYRYLCNNVGNEIKHEKMYNEVFASRYFLPLQLSVVNQHFTCTKTKRGAIAVWSACIRLCVRESQQSGHASVALTLDIISLPSPCLECGSDKISRRAAEAEMGAGGERKCIQTRSVVRACSTSW